jgi:hypothetical protein
LELVPSTFPGQGRPDELKETGAEKGGLFAPDAFANPQYIQFAIKGALPAFTCCLIFTLALAESYCQLPAAGGEQGPTLASSTCRSQN